MKKAFLLTGLLSFLIGVNLTYGQSDIGKIKDLIIATPKINVANATDPDGDILIPKQSVGFSGSGSNRVEQFEERRRLTKVLEKYIAFNPNVDALFPGSLVQGKSLPDGVLSPIKTIRNPLTITITDLISSSPTATYSQRINDPTLASVTDAVGKILNQKLQSDQPAKITYSETSISSVEEGFLKLGSSFKWVTGNVSGSFQTSSTVMKTSFMVRYVQSYYTVSCEPPSDPSSFISKETKFNDFKNYSDATNPSTYISSVTYGRELWMLVESNSETNEVKEALNAAFSAGFTGGSAELNNEQKKILNESNIQILILGGSGPSAVEVVAGDHISKLKEYLIAGANYSKTSPGVIISYTVRYLQDNDVARVSSSTDYTIKTNVSKPEIVHLTGMKVTWTTTGDDKDWDSQPVIDVYDKVGRRVGHIDCCSADRNGDHWNSGSSQTRDLQILIGGLTLDDLTSGHFSNSLNHPHGGNDNWDFQANVQFLFSNGITIGHTCGGRNGCGSNW